MYLFIDLVSKNCLLHLKIKNFFLAISGISHLQHSYFDF